MLYILEFLIYLSKNYNAFLVSIFYYLHLYILILFIYSFIHSYTKALVVAVVDMYLLLPSRLGTLRRRPLLLRP